MAQQDTGLGWSAKDTWLHEQSGIVVADFSTIGGPSFPNQPLPKNITTRADCESRGFPFAKRIKSGSAISYMGTWNEYDVVLFCVRTSIRITFTAVSTNPNARCVKLEDGNWYDNGGAGYPINDYHAASGLYYTEMASFRTEYFDSLNVPEYSSFAEGMAAVQVITKSYYKLNTGYAVCAIPSFYYTDGTLYTTPALISTDKNAVTLSLDGTTPDVAEQLIVSALIDGLTFYMGYILNPDLPKSTGGVGQVADLSQFAASLPSKVLKILATESFSNIKITESPDPYQEEEGSGEAGGDGEEDETDDVDFTDPPSTSIGATGLLTIFCPNLSQLQSLGSYMWSTFDVDNWRKIIANPMDAILGLHTIPVPAVITGTKAVKVAGIDTTIDMSYTTVRYIRRPMGSCEIPKKWGAYLDYSPYTKISIFLPFIGFKELDADDIMGKTIELQYMIDILTGACVAELKCGSTVLYTWSGNCANEVPISGSDWRGAIASAIGIAATVAGTALVTGGATAPMAASMVASVGANSMNLKPTINRSGAISGSAGYMGQKRPYIIRSIPNLVIPADQNKFIGYPSFVTASLGSLTGYNEIASVHLEGIPATGNELAEIETLLKGGVIL